MRVLIKLKKETYSDGYRPGVQYTSVSYQGKNYCGGSPCDNEHELQRAIQHAKNTITYHGDSWQIINCDQRESLLDFF